MVLVFFVCSDFYITVLYKFSVIHQQIFVSYSQFICIIIYSSANNPPRPDWLWGPTQSPVQWVPRALSPRVKRPGGEADHSPVSSAEVQDARNYTSTPPTRLHGLVLS
jgi:hypothetical protein